MRLIDANRYCKELYAERDYPGRTEEFISAMEVAIADLCDMPTVDAVEVVRCKDCRDRVAGYCAAEIDGIVKLRAVKDDDFCSYGERRTGRCGRNLNRIPKKLCCNC